MVRLFFAALALAFASSAPGQTVVRQPVTIKLYPKGAPGSEARRNEPEKAADYWVKNVHDPSITIFPADPTRANGAAIVVLPGGGHGLLVYNNEGVKSADVLSRMGVTTIVVKYRLAREEGSKYSIEGDAAGDAARAIKWIRAHAAEYRIDPKRIGVMGFSAGGELVSLIANYPSEYRKAPRDELSNISGRPDFQVLVFPGPLAVKGKIGADAPPAFLVAGSRDECCGPPTVALYELLRKTGVSAELHMYAEAGHAFNLDETDRISVAHWPDRLFDWLSDGGWLNNRPKP